MFWVKSNTKDKEIRLRILLVGSEVLSYRKESFQEVRTNLSSVGSLTGTGPSDSEVSDSQTWAVLWDTAHVCFWSGRTL